MCVKRWGLYTRLCNKLYQQVLDVLDLVIAPAVTQKPSISVSAWILDIIHSHVLKLVQILDLWKMQSSCRNRAEPSAQRLGTPALHRGWDLGALWSSWNTLDEVSYPLHFTDEDTKLQSCWLASSPRAGWGRAETQTWVSDCWERTPLCIMSSVQLQWTDLHV